MTMFISLLLSPFILTLCAATETTALLRSVIETLSHARSAGFHKSSTSPGIITTVAGDSYLFGDSVTDGVAATSGKISSPEGLAFDKEGNFYIAASGDHKIYKVTTSSGIINTAAGTGVRGYGGDRGLATSAMLCSPRGLSLDTTGNIFIADTLNNRIRKITMSTGLITTVAGGGNNLSTEDNIAAMRTSLKSPTDVTVDPSGNMFIADRDNRLIRKVTASTGIMTIIAGMGESYEYSGRYGRKARGGVATKYYLWNPTGVTLDTSGNVYVADGSSFSILKITVSTGNISTVAGTPVTNGYNGDDILATAAYLNHPTKVVFDASGNMYISDTGNRRIRKVTASTGMISTVAGMGEAISSDLKNGEGGLATLAAIHNPSGIAIDVAGNLYYAESTNSVVRKIAFNGATPSVSASSAPSVEGAPSAPLSAPVASTPTLFISTAPTVSPSTSISMAPTPGASSLSTSSSSSSISSSPSLSPTVRPSTSISMAPTPGDSSSSSSSPSSSISSSPSSSPAVTPSTSISNAPTPGASSLSPSSSSSKASVAPSSTATQSSSTTHFAQTIHLTMILVSSLLILHLCRDA